MIDGTDAPTQHQAQTGLSIRKGSISTILKKKSHVILWILCLLWLAFLFWLSSEDGASTAHTSQLFSQWVVQLLRLPQEQLAQVDAKLRVAAHFIGFFILGTLTATASKITWKEAKGLGLKVIAVGAILAVLDEVKKLYISGRHLSWPEAGLNILGVVGGVLLSSWFFWWIANVKTRRSQTRQPNA
ncbi:MAG: VanZ family protein [Sphaerochaeta sp.]|nr:VanZ family protein [Sphaerochaeta sp.]